MTRRSKRAAHDVMMGGETEAMRPLERHNFCLIGILPAQIIELGQLFKEGDRDRLSKELREEAGFPWANAFENLWETDQDQARQKGLFDLVWHRRAMAMDPVVNAPDFTGFDVLLNITKQAAPELGNLLAAVDGNDSSNPRRTQGPEWWEYWHHATGSRPGGWLSDSEAVEIHQAWPQIANPEIEEACLSIMGVTYTHPGCWGLMEDFGGFFAQCSSEHRAVVAEVDL